MLGNLSSVSMSLADIEIENATAGTRYLTIVSSSLNFSQLLSVGQRRTNSRTAHSQARSVSVYDLLVCRGDSTVDYLLSTV